MRFFKQIALATALLAPVTLQAQTWTNWTAATCGSSGSWTGSIGTTVVTYSGACIGGQLSNGTGTDYYSPQGPYTVAGYTLPDAGNNYGFIQFEQPYSGSLTFSTPVTNPILAFISLGNPGLGVTFTFTQPGGAAQAIYVLSDDHCAGPGGVPPADPAYFSCGSYTTGSTDGGTTTNTLTGSEYSGLVELQGTFTSVNFTSATDEYWYGFTVGTNAPNVVTSVTPEPATMSLMAMGLVGLVGVGSRRMRRKA
jgi:hypothetical protein